MRYIDILLEFDLQKTIQNYSEKLLDRSKSDHSAKNKPIEEIINLFVQSDPTSKKAYTLWMINTYLANGIRFLEDLGRAKDALITYIDLKFKNKLRQEHKDINKIKYLNELEGLIDEYKEKPIIAQSERQRENELEQDFYKNKEAELFYNDNEIKVVIPKTERASCFFGRNTKWCTAATNNNMFSRYNKKGTLYIVLIKKENKRFQFHFETNQFMDERDKDIENWDEIVSKYPKLLDIFDQMARKHLFLPLVKNPDKDIQLAAVNQNGRVIQYIKNSDKDVQLAAVNQNGRAIQYIKNPDKEIQLAAVKQNRHAIQYINNPDKDVQLAAVKQDGSAIQFIKKPDKDVQLAAVNQNGHAIGFINNLDKDVQLAAVNQNGYAIQFINNPDKDIQLAAVKRDGFAIQFIKNPDKDVQITAVKRDGLAIQVIKNPDKDIQLAAVNQNGYVICYIKNPDKDVQLIAKKKNIISNKY